jgi:hypothetical protein
MAPTKNVKLKKIGGNQSESTLGIDGAYTGLISCIATLEFRKTKSSTGLIKSKEKSEKAEVKPTTKKSSNLKKTRRTSASESVDSFTSKDGIVSKDDISSSDDEEEPEVSLGVGARTSKKTKTKADEEYKIERKELEPNKYDKLFRLSKKKVNGLPFSILFHP